MLRASLDAPRLLALAARQPGQVIRRIASRRTVKQVGWKGAPVLLRQAAFVAKQPAPAGDADAARRFVILSSDSHALPRGSDRLFRRVIEFLRAQGWVVLHNVMDPAQAAPGTAPLVCSYAEFLGLRAAGVPFVGWRSGLCDIAAASAAPMGVIYPDTLATCTPLKHLTARTPVELFGFTAMNVATRCVDLVCDGAENLDLEALTPLLDPGHPAHPQAAAA